MNTNFCHFEVRQKVSKKTINEILTLFNFFKRHNIPIFARDGLLLGCVRHGGFLPFDKDPDVGILAEHYHKLKVPDGYAIKEPPTLRNLKYKLKTNVAYDFRIVKEKIKSKYLFVLLVLLCLIIITKFQFSLKTFVILFVIFIIWILLPLLPFINEEILDGTVYPSKNHKEYYQEVERGERHVFRKDYGHSENENYFCFQRDDILPLVEKKFYHGNILVPNKSKKFLKEHYGKDVFKVMYKKEDKDMVKINIENCIAKPAELVG